ncbi:hypothetical protein Dimus_007921 [Dionaea muscipula]
MHVAACKEFYKNLTVSISKTKEVAKSSVRGVKIELDGMILSSILGVPGDNGICEYIKDVWEESTYCKPLEITKKFANDEFITVARRVKSTEMKLFQRLLHFIVMKNVAPRFEKRETTSFLDLTYMDYLLTRRLVNLPRVMLRHMAYVIYVPCLELSYGSGEKFYDALSDEGPIEALDVVAPTAPGVNVPTPAASADTLTAPTAFPASPADSTSMQIRGKKQIVKRTDAGVEPSGPSGHLPDFDLLHLQAAFAKALQRNT